MRPLLRIAALMLATLAATAGPAGAERLAYEGTEAQALECAAYYAFTAQVFETRGMMSAETGDEARLVASFILSRHVGGTETQRLAAYRGTLAGMAGSDPAMVDDAVNHLEWCRKRFVTP